MLEFGIVILWAAAIFGAIAVNLVVKPERLPKLLGIFGAVTLLGGAVFYGAAFYELLGDAAQTAVRTVYATCRIMIGENDYGDIADTAILSSAVGQLLFWLLHLLGLMTTAGAAITAIGSGLIRKLRLLLNRKSSLSVIYGVDENTIAFGRELMEQENTIVIYVQESVDEVCRDSITETNCIIRTDISATTPDKYFLRSIGMGKGKRKLRLYALSDDPVANEAYAAAFRDIMETEGILPEQISLTLLTPEPDVDTEECLLVKRTESNKEERGENPTPKAATETPETVDMETSEIADTDSQKETDAETSGTANTETTGGEVEKAKKRIDERAEKAKKRIDERAEKTKKRIDKRAEKTKKRIDERAEKTKRGIDEKAKKGLNGGAKETGETEKKDSKEEKVVKYGYNSVITMNEPEMAARLLTMYYPPAETLSFDKYGAIRGNFHALIIGFGQKGQAVLRQLAMHGQFMENITEEGAEKLEFRPAAFRAAVFSKKGDEGNGRFTHQYKQFVEEYEIEFFENDGKSKALYEYIQNNAETLKYVVICTGNVRQDMEIEQELRQYFRQLNAKVLMFRISKQGIVYKREDGVIIHHALYCHDTLCAEWMDKPAMLVNHAYNNYEGTAEGKWKECNAFGRMSSRASADFFRSMLLAAGMTEQEVLDGKWNWSEDLLEEDLTEQDVLIKGGNPQKVQFENLSKTEHLRWNAFHFAMGISTMPREVFEERSARYQKEIDAGNEKFRISKDIDGLKMHACLIPWEELDELARRKNAVTGGSKNFKKEDRKNVLAMGDVIRVYRDSEEQERHVTASAQLAFSGTELPPEQRSQ